MKKRRLPEFHGLLLPERVCGFFFLHKKKTSFMKKIKFSVFLFSIHLFWKDGMKNPVLIKKKNIKWGRREREGVRGGKKEGSNGGFA